MNMLENIRRIGIFMIVAQTVMHFAAGKQYEKYMKMIAGVIVLLQFISPFVSSVEDIVAKWQEEAQKMIEQTERLSSVWQSELYSDNYAETLALRQIEREVKTRLNEMMVEREYYIEDVSIDLEETGKSADFQTGAGEYGWEFRRIRIVLRERPDIENEMQNKEPVKKIQDIQIEEIIIGNTEDSTVGYEQKQELACDMAMEEYRLFFAQALGITADRVEVSYYGGE